MVLTLEVTPPHAASLGASRRRVFSTAGGAIGRAASSDWILSHRKVSGRHALITYQDGSFYIVDDTSANGVFLNSAKNRLIPGKRYALKSGDRIIIDPYEIDVSISAESHMDSAFEGTADRPWEPGPFESPGQADPFSSPPQRTPAPYRQTPAAPRATPAGQVVPADELDPLKLLDGSAPPKPAVAPRAHDLEGGSMLSAHFRPPDVPTPPPEPRRASRPQSPFEIPADYDPLRDDGPDPFGSEPSRDDSARIETPQPEIDPQDETSGGVTPLRGTPRPVAANDPPTPARTPIPEPGPSEQDRRTPPPEIRPATTTAPPDSGLLAVLEGAGLERAPVTAEFARNFGRIFRVVVSGVMDVLRARQQIKDEFRMRLTQFRPADNNPLKFSANVDDALHNLLVKRNPAYLEPVEAFEDAFEDLRNHQIAMLAGMRTAFESMLAHFHPEALRAQFDRQAKRSALLSLTARMQYWDLYRDRHEELTKDPETAFRRLFGDEFARAYEEQLQRLKAEASGRHSAPPPGG